MKIVLIIDDAEHILRYLSVGVKLALKEKEDVSLVAGNKKMASELFFQHKDTLKFICLDGCLQNTRVWDTKDLIDLFLGEGFSGHIIAMSSSEDFREEMVKAGCKHACPKADVPGLISKLTFNRR